MPKIRRPFHVLSLTTALFLLLASAAAPRGPLFAAQEDVLQAALERPILAPGGALAELRDYCERRIPPMPVVESAGKWRRYADRIRAGTLERVIFRGEAARWRRAQTRVEWLDALTGGPGYRIRKLRYEALPGLWVPALLYEPERVAGRVPVVLNVNGHDGKGKAADYKQVRCINLAKRGMLALNVEWFGMGQFRTPAYGHDLINAIDLCGTAGIATHYLMLKRGIDVLLDLEHADPKRVAVTGLSGGGWQTIFISAFDPRVTLTDPVAGYSSFRTRARHDSDLGDSEQTPCDLATITDYAQMTAMMAPRATLLTYNAKDDCCFRAAHALPPLMDAARPVFRLFGKEANLRSHVNEDPGTHNYLVDNREAFYRMLGDHFYAGRADYPRAEIPSDPEVKAAEELHVPLPPDNASLLSLARSLSRELPRRPELPDGRTRVERWQRARRAELREVVRARDYRVTAERVGTERRGALSTTFWKLRIRDARDGLTVPLVEIAGDPPRETVLLLADGGRRSAGAAARALLGQGCRVLAVDPFYVGESLPDPQRAYLWALLVAAIGDRPVGLQASQIAAISRWAASERGWGPVRVVAGGPRTSLAALVASGLEKDAIRGLELGGALGSLKEAIERPIPYSEAPELFCFGLLEAFDTRQLTALVAPRPVLIRDADGRAQAELGSLTAWFDRLAAAPGAFRVQSGIPAGQPPRRRQHAIADCPPCGP